MKKSIAFAWVVLSLLVLGPFKVTEAGADPKVPVTPNGQLISETLDMRVTAYASVPDETDDTPFITASGLHVADGIVASNALPLGTRIEIPSLFGDKVFVVEDRMSKHFMNTIDVWMPTKQKALVFGLNYADIDVTQGPALTYGQAAQALGLTGAEALAKK